VVPRGAALPRLFAWLKLGDRAGAAEAEWRESNGQYILAAVATGLIASAIINGGR